MKTTITIASLFTIFVFFFASIREEPKMSQEEVVQVEAALAGVFAKAELNACEAQKTLKSCTIKAKSAQ